MRTREQRIERLVCAEHCRFYKPWQAGASRCGAYRWLLQRSLASERVLDLLEHLRGDRLGAAEVDDALLTRSACNRCDYFPSACAYRDPARAKGAVACGALRVLRTLLDREQLSLEELYADAGGRPATNAAGEPLGPRT